MKKHLLIACLFLFPMGLFAQPNSETDNRGKDHISHSKGDISILFSSDILYDTPGGVYQAGGMKLRMFVSKRFSFDSDCVAGRNYYHIGPGMLGLPLWGLGTLFDLSLGDQMPAETIIFLSTLMLLSAEHVSYHIPLNNNTDFSPYMSLLRYKSIRGLSPADDSEKDKSTYNCALGLEINQYIGQFVVSPYVDYDIAYIGHNRSLNFGLNVGFYFPSNK